MFTWQPLSPGGEAIRDAADRCRVRLEERGHRATVFIGEQSGQPVVLLMVYLNNYDVGTISAGLDIESGEVLMFSSRNGRRVWHPEPLTVRPAATATDLDSAFEARAATFEQLGNNAEAALSEANTGNDTRERLKHLMQEFEASHPPNDDRTRDLRWSYLVADVALEKGRANGEQLAAAWLNEMAQRAAA